MSWPSMHWRRGALIAQLLPLLLPLLSATPAGATDGGGTDQLARDRELAAATARRLDAVEADASELEHQISTTASSIGSLQDEARQLRREVRRRAASLYTRSGTSLDTVMQTDNSLDGARAAQLTEVANRNGLALAARLGSVTKSLQQRAEDLREQRAEFERARATLVSERDELERRIDAAVVASRMSSPLVRGVSATSFGASGAYGSVWLRFRECTFAHESGGDYAIVSPDGLYYGAWQFAPSTWNSVAGGMGRSDLTGVLPSQAAPDDQDAVAHALWLEAGNQPWGGRC